MLQKSADAHLSHMNQHKENAQNAIQARTIRTDNEIKIVWESAQALRMSAHESDLEQYYFERFIACGLGVNRALWRDYQHSQLVKQNTEKQKVVPVMTYRAYRQTLLAGKVTNCTESPPGVDFALPVLASCSASNAPNARASHSILTTGLTH